MEERASSKGTIICLAAISLIIFLLFIPVNLKGAQDAEMLSAFEIDEFAQYPHVIRMLTPGGSFYQTLRNFFVYEHYFYGFPFYFFSALTLLPLRLVIGAGWEAQTPLIVMLLRQMISVLPMLAAIWILVWLQTRFKSAIKSAALFIFLAILPAVVLNNLWWHIDSLAVLVAALAFLFLDRDQQRYGKFFYIAALICGVGVGIKYIGLVFCLAVPVYLLSGLIAKKISLGKAALSALLFLVFMAGGLVASNPLLLLPMERAAIIRTAQQQFVETGTGYFIAYQSNPFSESLLSESFRIHYGGFIFLLIALAALVWNIITGKNRLHNSLIAAFILPMFVILISAATRRTHYFLPLALPLYSTFGAIQIETAPGLKAGRAKYWKYLAPLALLVILAGQSFAFARQDVQYYREALTREETSPSIAFSRKVMDLLQAAQEGSTLRVYKDWKIYLPQQPGLEVHMDWDLATYKLIEELDPDVILLEFDNIHEFSKEGILEQAVDPEHLAAMQRFYLDAKNNQIEGYELIMQDEYGRAYLKRR